MSIKIHYGPNGSYKTSGAIHDDLIPAWLAGRTIVTNIRGVSRDRFQEAGFDPEDKGGEIIVVDGDTQEGNERMARFFHWAPPGALIFVDEASSVWPKHWRDPDLRQLDFEGGPEAAQALNRPANYWIAFEKHRHWNWDLVLTSPNIIKIRPEIRECADAAYKHKNLALLGLPGRYVEGVHAPLDGGNKSDFTSVTNRKISKKVFSCYDSTKTGLVSDTISGRALWKNPRVVMLVMVVVLALFYGLRGASSTFDRFYGSHSPAEPVAVVPAPSVVPVRSPSGEVRTVPAGGLPAQPANPSFRVATPYDDAVLVVVGYVKMRERVVYQLRVTRPGRAPYVITTDDLRREGFLTLGASECRVTVFLGGGVQNEALCGEVARSV